jgi:hypothetical protein
MTNEGTPSAVQGKAVVWVLSPRPASLCRFLCTRTSPPSSVRKAKVGFSIQLTAKKLFSARWSPPCMQCFMQGDTNYCFVDSVAGVDEASLRTSRGRAIMQCRQRQPDGTKEARGREESLSTFEDEGCSVPTPRSVDVLDSAYHDGLSAPVNVSKL